ncbi:MAG: hypothetical protein KAU95_01205, partial [Candidatus Aenigmarchaeota archaeon]|nr:hypothetical protein [Candidatus Aenigmarchaeota archaeon]
KGPEIYDEVLISMPYASSLQDKNLTVSIPLLYDNEFNPIWNFTAGDNITNIQNNESLEDYRDYLNSSYESYLNGTGVVCSETDENLSVELCYKDTANKVIWIKIPHFSGVGPKVTGTGTSTGEVNFSVSKTALNSTYEVGDFVEYIINITNNDDQNITRVNINDTFNSTYLAFDNSNVTENSTGAGWVYWFNVTNGAVIRPSNTFTFAVNMTALAIGDNITNSISVNATRTDGNTSTAEASVNISIPIYSEIYEPDDNYTEANWILTNNSLQTHKINPVNDTDWMKFNATIGSKYLIKTSNLTGGTDTEMTLYNTDGTTIIMYSDDISSGINQSSSILFIPNTNGTYFIKINDWNSSFFGGSYQIGAQKLGRLHPYLIS